jgi:hypothetical protein
MDKGVFVDSNHGYTPHITLAYLDPEKNNPLSEIEATLLEFDSVTVMSGSRRIDIPFWRAEPPYSLSETIELPLNSPVDVNPGRALFGDFSKEWIPFLPKPGKYVHESFGNLDFTAETYSDIIRNFDNYVYKQDLPIRATHMPSDGGAIGWIKPGGLRLAEDGSIEAKPEWNELGKGLIEDNRFLYTSAEFCKVWTNPVTQEKIPNVAVGLALVTRPHFKTDVLAPLSEREALAFSEAEASQTESGVAGEGQLMDPKDTTATPPASITTPPAPTETTTAPPAVNPLDPNNQVVLSDLNTVVLTAEQRRLERQQFADLNSRVELAERRAVTAEAKVAEMEAERRTEKYTAEVLGRSSENNVAWFGPVKENVQHLVSLAEKYGDNSAEVKWAVTQKRNEATAIHKTGIFDPISVGVAPDGASAQAQVAHLAEQMMISNPGMSREAAETKVYDQNPDLYLKTLK